MKHNLYAIFLFLLLSPVVSAQQLVDECLTSVVPSPSFNSGPDLVNVEEFTSGSDLVSYTGGEWTAASEGSNLSAPPPVNCDVSNAIFMRAENAGGEGFGMRLATPINNGTAVSFDITGIAHGAGSANDFQVDVYTAATQNLYIGGVFQGVGPVATITFGPTWSVQEVEFTPNFGSNGHTFLFFFAAENSGMVLNFCQQDPQPLNFALPESIAACEGETVVLGGDALEDLNVTWNTGATTPEIDVTTTGSYGFSASNGCNWLVDESEVTFFGEPELVPDNDTTICLGTTLELRTEGVNAQNLWSDGSTDSLLLVSDAGMYGVTVTDDCGSASYMIEISLDSIPPIDLGPDTALCQDETLLLDAGLDDPNIGYFWSDGTTGPTLTVSGNESASYTLEAINQCGTASDTRFVEYSLPPAGIFDSNAYEPCFGVTFTLDVGAIEGSYVWRDGSTAPTYLVGTGGFHWVTITDDDDCWVVSDTTFVQSRPCDCPMFMPNAFTPNNDGLNDEWAPVFECEPYDYTLQLYDRWGRVMRTFNSPVETWNGTIGGEPVKDGIYNYVLFYREVFDGIPITKRGHVVVLQD